MRPTYGTDVARAMFENQSDAKKAIDQAIRTAISTWIPEVDVDSVNVNTFDDSGKVGVEVNIILPDFTSTTVNVLSTTLNPNGSTTR